MPNIGNVSNHQATPNDPNTNTSGFEFEFATSATDPVTLSFGMVQDNPTSTTEQGAALSVIDKFALNQSQQLNWRLRRIVGKLFISAGFTTPDIQNNPPPDAIIVSAGIIVRRVDQDGNPLAVSEQEDVNTLLNNTDPWIWRRDWILGQTGFDNDGQTTVNTAGRRNFPPTNAGYGSVKDGPHIDQKTNRVIGQEERLFLNLTAQILPYSLTPAEIFVLPRVYLNFQYRCLGQVFQNSGNRRNASR